jgi:hypothetical protein
VDLVCTAAKGAATIDGVRPASCETVQGFESLQQIHDAIRGFAKLAQDDSDPLTSIIGEHLAVRARRDIWREESPPWGEPPLERGGEATASADVTSNATILFGIPARRVPSSLANWARSDFPNVVLVS